jgi:hypothetical protein
MASINPMGQGGPRNKLPPSRDKRTATRREHAIGGVIGGSTIVAGGPAAAITGRDGLPKCTQKVHFPHPSTTAAQRQPGGRGSPTGAIAPRQPIVANPSTPRPTPTPGITYGAHGPRGERGHAVHVNHDPALGDRILAEGIFSGSARFPGERHHSTCSTTKGKLR